MTLNINGTTHFAKWSPSSRTFTLAADGAEWTATLTARDTNYLAISSTISNTSQAPIKLVRATLADAQLNLGDQTSALLMSGWGVWIGVKPITSQKQVSKTLTQLYNPKSHAALQLGFETFDRINTEQELWFDESSKLIFYTLYRKVATTC